MEARVAELESKLSTEMSMVNTLRSFLEQSRKERDYLQTCLDDKKVENDQAADNKMKRTDVDKLRTDLAFMERQYLTVVEKLKVITTERDSLSTQLKAHRRLQSDFVEKPKKPRRLARETQTETFAAEAELEFEISMKQAEVRNLTNRLTTLTAWVSRPKPSSASQTERPVLAERAVQVEVKANVDYSDSLSHLKSHLECACRTDTSRLLTLLPCGHISCEYCCVKGMEGDELLRGWPCPTCGTIAVTVLPATAIEKVRSCLKLIETRN